MFLNHVSRVGSWHSHIHISPSTAWVLLKTLECESICKKRNCHGWPPRHLSTSIDHVSSFGGPLRGLRPDQVSSDVSSERPQQGGIRTGFSDASSFTPKRPASWA